MIKRLWDNFKSWPDDQRGFFLWATVPGLVGSIAIIISLISVYFAEFLDEINEILAPVIAIIGLLCYLLYPISFIILMLFPFIYWRQGWRQALSPFAFVLVYGALHYFTHAYVALYLIHLMVTDELGLRSFKNFQRFPAVSDFSLIPVQTLAIDDVM